MEFDLLTPAVIFIYDFLKIFNYSCKSKKRNGCFSRIPFEIYVEYKPVFYRYDLH